MLNANGRFASDAPSAGDLAGPRAFGVGADFVFFVRAGRTLPQQG